jgi:hypothetical protein
MHIFDVYKNGEFLKRMDVHGKFDALNELKDWGNYPDGDPCGWWAPLHNSERTARWGADRDFIFAVIDGDEYRAIRIGFTGWNKKP